MEEFTRKFNVAQEKDAEIRHILTTVYAALADKRRTPPISRTITTPAR